jgi:hypothetical protein
MFFLIIVFVKYSRANPPFINFVEDVTLGNVRSVPYRVTSYVNCRLRKKETVWAGTMTLPH